MNIERILCAMHESSDSACTCADQAPRKTSLKTVIDAMLSLCGVKLLKKKTIIRLDEHMHNHKHDADFAFYFVTNTKGIDTVYQCVADDLSRESLDRYIRYRLAIPFQKGVAFHDQYGLNTDFLVHSYQSTLASASLPALSGAPKSITDIVLTQTFLARQYAFDDVDLVRQGDVVLDCGGFLGETALYFAKLCGPEGHVFCFEPDKDYFEKAVYNAQKNTKADTITMVNSMVSDADSPAQYEGCYVEKANNFCQATTIDAFCSQTIQGVDIIKMDIEGAELQALRGARQTICKHKPILMISAYHKPDDLVSLTEFIKELQCGYKLYIRDRADLVLFAIPEDKQERLV